MKYNSAVDVHVDAQTKTIKLNVSDLQAKAQSKAEMHALMAISGKAYLPDVKNVTSFFLRDLLSGKRNVSCLSGLIL